MKYFLDELELEDNEATREIRSLTALLENHDLYYKVKTLEDVQTYMAYQVWCVWDFMALLKALQNGLLRNNILWTPPSEGNIAAYIYEILLTEETDITDTGSGRCSHFETYLKAMQQAGADTGAIDNFIQNIRHGHDFNQAVGGINIPVAALQFVENTLKHANSSLHEVVSVFCLSREGIIPVMFKTFLKTLSNESQLSTFRWYLERHITVDSESHGPLSVRLFKTVVGDDPIKLTEALTAAKDALHARILFLDSILIKIQSS